MAARREPHSGARAGEAAVVPERDQKEELASRGARPRPIVTDTNPTLQDGKAETLRVRDQSVSPSSLQLTLGDAVPPTTRLPMDLLPNRQVAASGSFRKGPDLQSCPPQGRWLPTSSWLMTFLPLASRTRESPSAPRRGAWEDGAPPPDAHLAAVPWGALEGRVMLSCGAC